MPGGVAAAVPGALVEVAVGCGLSVAGVESSVQATRKGYGEKDKSQSQGLRRATQVEFAM